MHSVSLAATLAQLAQAQPRLTALSVLVAAEELLRAYCPAATARLATGTIILIRYKFNLSF